MNIEEALKAAPIAAPQPSGPASGPAVAPTANKEEEERRKKRKKKKHSRDYPPYSDNHLNVVNSIKIFVFSFDVTFQIVCTLRIHLDDTFPEVFCKP